MKPSILISPEKGLTEAGAEDRRACANVSRSRPSPSATARPAGRPRPSSGGSICRQAIQVVMVNESGASVYSASEVAREEFPDQDVTVRGSVSIGRRLMDPLAELVKIDPKSIGVGQYQHDVDQAALEEQPRRCGDQLRQRGGGRGEHGQQAASDLCLRPGAAAGQRNIVEYRNEHGPFRSREELKKVPDWVPRPLNRRPASCASGTAKILWTASAVHPESYPIVDAMAADLGCSVDDLMRDEELRKQIDLNRLRDRKVGLPTLKDILAELAKPGRDPREEFESVQLCRRRGEDRRRQAGHEAAGHRDQCHRLRRLRRHRRPPGRAGPHQRACGSVREEPGRGGEGPSAGDGDGAGGGSAKKADLPFDEGGSGRSETKAGGKRRTRKEREKKNRQSGKGRFSNNPFLDAFKK